MENTIIDIETWPDAALHELISMVQDVLARRHTTNIPVAYNFSLGAGNRRAGAKAWVKRITGVDPTKGNGYGILGDFVRDEGAVPEGTYLLVGGSGGSWKNTSWTYALVCVGKGRTFDIRNRYQAFCGDGAALVASSTDEVAVQEVLARFPELAPSVGKPLFPIYAALRAAGL